MKVYKIKSLKTGRFSTGGWSPSFTKKGKTWAERGHVSSHLSAQDKYGRQSYKLNECVIVCYDFEAGTEEVFDIDQWRADVEQRREAREATKEKQRAVERLRYAEESLEAAKRNLERLQRDVNNLKK